MRTCNGRGRYRSDAGTDPQAVDWIDPRLTPGEERRVMTGIPGKTGTVYALDHDTGAVGSTLFGFALP